MGPLQPYCTDCKIKFKCPMGVRAVITKNGKMYIGNSNITETAKISLKMKCSKKGHDLSIIVSEGSCGPTAQIELREDFVDQYGKEIGFGEWSP